MFISCENARLDKAMEAPRGLSKLTLSPGCRATSQNCKTRPCNSNPSKKHVIEVNATHLNDYTLAIGHGAHKLPEFEIPVDIPTVIDYVKSQKWSTWDIVLTILATTCFVVVVVLGTVIGLYYHFYVKKRTSNKDKEQGG